MNYSRHHLSTARLMKRIAIVTSWILNPFSIPFLAFLILFLFTYLRMMPMPYKIVVLAIVYCFTILMPIVTIFIYRRINKLTLHDISRYRTSRFRPFLLTITSYGFCLAMMHKLSIPWYMTGIILAALVIQVICVIVNLRWKLSEHMAGMGGVVGGVIAFSALFGYNPLGWLCLFILIAGILGTSRMILKHHSLGEVLCGFTVGFACAILVLHPWSNVLFRVFLLN